MVRVEIQFDGHTNLIVESDGKAHFKIKGDRLRYKDNKRNDEYETDDDFHVIGLIHYLLGAYFSMEVLQRALAEREPKFSDEEINARAAARTEKLDKPPRA